MKILISGATGFIGRTLTDKLIKSGHQLFAIVRKTDNRLPESITQFTLDSLPSLDRQMDVFINLAGEGIADKPWSESRKQILWDSRVTLTQDIRDKLKLPPKKIISMSAIGFYGSATNGEFDEFSPPQSGFAHDLCKAWEESAKDFETEGSRVVIFRLGVVLGSKGGALKKMQPSYRLGLGGKIGTGEQWFSWVHKQDVMSAIEKALGDDELSGVYNLVSPGCVKQKIFAKMYAASLNRPSWFTIPALLLKTLFGEMSELLIMGPKVIPKRLSEAGFAFQYEHLKEALEEINKN